ncbi:hypothetical protein BH24ACT3_BH24ACT3_08140 [soil metagenome]
MESPEFWRWVWLVGTVAFALGELSTAGTFFLMPFALGAAVAAVLAFAGVDVGIEWLAFLAVSVGAFAAMRPLARRLDAGGPQDGIGAKRLIGQPARVLTDIPAGDLGLVQVNREEWRAETVDGTSLAAGTPVKVVEVRGTRVVVWPVGDPALPHSPEAQPPDGD